MGTGRGLSSDIIRDKRHHSVYERIWTKEDLAWFEDAHMRCGPDPIGKHKATYRYQSDVSRVDRSMKAV
jgi:hypothetical protein